MNDILTDLEVDPVIPSKTDKKKVHFIHLLVEARKKLKDHDKDNWEAILKENIAQRFQGSEQSATEIAKKELKDTFFTFANSAALSTIGAQPVHMNRRQSDTESHNEFSDNEEFWSIMDDFIKMGCFEDEF